MVKKNIINYSDSEDSSDEKNCKIKLDYTKLKLGNKLKQSDN
jgi:hypothetical protein